MMKSQTLLRLLVLSSMWAALAAHSAEPDVLQRSTSPLVAQALRLEHGEGVPKNTARAAELYCAAIRMGNTEAAYRLGWMYANGRGLPRSDSHAVALFTRAAGQGHAEARRMLSHIAATDARLPPCVSPPAADAEPATPPAQTDAARTVQALPAPAAGTQRLNSAPAPDAPKVAFAETTSAKATAPAEHPTPPDFNKEISQVIAQWAHAWSRKDTDGYLAAYAKTFAVPGGRSLRQWELERRSRITDKSWITVKIDALEIAVEGNHARASFRQDYRSDKLSEVSSKTLELIKVDQKWLIQRERGAN